MKIVSAIILCFLLILVSACAKKQDSLGNEYDANMVSSGNKTLVAAASVVDDDNFSDEFDDDDFSDDDFSDGFVDDDFDNYEVISRTDPLMGWNRFWFGFNDFALLQVGKPVHQVYVQVVPDTVKSGISSLRYNVSAPVRMANALLQFEFGQFFVEFGKLTINIITSAGFADVASRNKALVPHTPKNLRFGHTLAKWHFPQGPYLVLPFYGPSSVRETVGTVADIYAEPLAYFIPWQASLALASIFQVNDFEQLYTAYGQLKENAFDPYLSLRNIYLEQLTHSDPQY